MGLGVNKATHTNMEMRRINEILLADMTKLGDLNSAVDKKAFKEWLHKCLAE